MLSSQLKLSLSYYSDLYDMIVPKDHILRKIRELVDFSFIYDELKNKYCLDNGRNAKNPILLFKYLLLKYLYNLSDNGVVERSRYDMSFKYFLELTPEEEVIHPSLLTKFRKQRLKDENILDLLINKSVELAINQGVLKSNTIIVDSTHTEARYHKTTQREMLKKASTSLKAALKDSQSNDYKLISKLNPSIIKGTRSEDGFIFNKDADTMQCPAGHLAIKYRIDKRSNQKKNTRIKYFFDINKCHVCPYRNGCYKENAKTKTYSITIKSDYHKNQEAFQKTQYFKERFKTRYMIEAKNSELKNIHGYSRCDAAGLSNMQLQGAVSIFAVNLKRILKLKGEVCPNEEK